LRQQRNVAGSRCGGQGQPVAVTEGTGFDPAALRAAASAVCYIPTSKYAKAPPTYEPEFYERFAAEAGRYPGR
jgi:hypothetical protein